MKHPTDRLPELRLRDVSAAASERIRQRVHHAAAQRRAGLAAPRSAAWSQYYHRFVEPTALVGLGVTHLLWALHGTLALLHP